MNGSLDNFVVSDELMAKLSSISIASVANLLSKLRDPNESMKMELEFVDIVEINEALKKCDLPAILVPVVSPVCHFQPGQVPPLPLPPNQAECLAALLRGLADLVASVAGGGSLSISTEKE